MSDLAISVGLLTRGLLIAILAGLVVRRRLRYSYALTIWIMLALAINLILMSSSSLSQNWTFWILKESAYALLRLIALLELTALTFHGLPRAKSLGFAVLGGVFVLLLIAVSWPISAPSPGRLGMTLVARFAYVAIWGFLGVLGLVTWYGVPLYPFHKAVLHGFVWSQIAKVAAASVPATATQAAWVVYNVVHLLILCLWTYFAWHPEEKPVDPNELTVLRRLQPWRLA